MTREQILGAIRAHLADELEVDPHRSGRATRFREDLDADSLDLYTLVQELEDSYGVKISDEEAARILTVGQAVEFVLASGIDEAVEELDPPDQGAVPIANSTSSPRPVTTEPIAGRGSVAELRELLDALPSGAGRRTSSRTPRGPRDARRLIRAARVPRGQRAVAGDHLAHLSRCSSRSASAPGS